MTRHDFLENVNDWYELKDFCAENNCDNLEDIYDEEGMDTEINYAVGEYARDYEWYEIRDMLDSIPSGFSYYCQNGSFDWYGMGDSDFTAYKQGVLEWMDNGGYWDDEDAEDEEYTDEEDISDEPDKIEEDFSVGDLIGMCSVAYATIQQDNRRNECEEAAAFNQFVNMPKVLRN